VRYPGPDNSFGRTDRTLVDDAVNPLGIVSTDPTGDDDLVIPTLLVPAGRPIVLLLGSKDVLHSFFIRELRIKQDTVPGMLTPLRFTADRPGRYEVACAELCGLGHHQMRTFLEVVDPEEYERRMEENYRLFSTTP
jgi:cytochrome c oxidase subunit 2